MHYIEFTEAEPQLNAFLNKKLMGEKMGPALCKRAQKLVDKWFTEQRKIIIMGSSGIRITGCVLAFEIGVIKVDHWLTRFIDDPFEIHRVSPGAIALGVLHGNQLYIADYEGVPHLCARDTPRTVRRWSATETMTPPMGTPLFMALERAKALGYLNHLKGLSC